MALRGLYGKTPEGAQQIGPEGEEAAAAQAEAAQAGTEATAPEAAEAAAGEGAVPSPQAQKTINTLINDANNAFNTYFKLLGENKYDQAAKELDRLERALQQLSEQSGGE